MVCFSCIFSNIFNSFVSDSFSAKDVFQKMPDMNWGVLKKMCADGLIKLSPRPRDITKCRLCDYVCKDVFQNFSGVFFVACSVHFPQKQSSPDNYFFRNLSDEEVFVDFLGNLPPEIFKVTNFESAVCGDKYLYLGRIIQGKEFIHGVLIFSDMISRNTFYMLKLQ